VAINVPIITTFADKGVNAAQKAFGNLSKSTVIAGAAIGATVTAVAAFGYSAIQKASDFNEAISKNTVVFGAISKEVENFAKTAGRSFGISETAALQAAGTFATFGKSAGLAGKDLSDFSIGLVTMAADLASFNNTSVDEAINALGSALRGEAEPLRKYGVLLSDTTLKAAATELGIYSGNKALTAQQKILAAQKVIFEQTADAQGDFSRTSTGLAAQQKILGATLENIQTNLGQAFLPLFLKAVQFFNNKVTPAFERVAEVIGEKGLVKGMQQALFEMGSFGPGMVNAFKQIAVTSAKAANALYKFGVVAGSGLAFAAGKYTTGISLLGKAFDELIDVDALGASFDNFAAGIKNMGSASDYSSFAAKQLAENAKSAADAADELSGTGTGKGATGAADKLKKMQKAAQEAAETLAKETAAAVKEAADALNKELADALDTAKTNLKDAQTKFSDFSTSVSEGVTGAFSFKDAQDAGAETGTGFITGLQDQVKKIAGYSYKVNELLRMGLSEQALKNVLAAGFESGNLIADYLIAGGAKTISETNALVQSVEDMGMGIGIAAANVFYSSGVSNAQDYLRGVQDAFDVAQGKLQGTGLNLADIKGISAGFNDSISGRIVEPIAPPSFDYNDPFGVKGNTYNINVSGVMSNAQTGEEIVNNIRAFNRAAGPANIAVA
jgi:gas vesicle protein